jgi:hypothetical protein
MSRTSKALKRLGVAGLAVATIGAGVPALVASSAQAATGGATTQLAIAPLSQTGAAGTCILYTVTPLNATGEQPGDTPTITVQVTENPVSDTQDVDFCTVADVASPASRGTSPYATGAVYMNGASVPTQQTYTPTGTNVSPTPAAVGGPDSASGASGQATATNTNPTGVDSARLTGTNDAATPTTLRPNNGSVVFGIVGAVAGGANITAFIDNGAGGGTANDYVRQAGEIKANTDATATFTGGGTPEAVAAVDAEPETGSSPINSLVTYTVTLKNSSGQTVSGVTPVAAITAGPDAAQAGATDGTQFAVAVTCGTTNNSGVTTCSYTTRAKTGTDTINTWVNKTCGLSAAFDSCEPNDEITRTVAPATSAARFIAITPRDVTTSAGTTRVFSATVTDVNGTPVPDVEVTFFENGAGRFVGPDTPTCDCLTTATGANGVATATVTSATAETGTQEISAFITGVGTRDATGKFTRTGGSNSGSTQCGQAAGTGAGATSTTPAGKCSDATTNTFVNGTPSPTTSPGGRAALTLTVNTPTIPAGSTARLTATGAANEAYQLMCYTRPSTTYVVARSGAFSATADPVTFTLSLGRNTRCFIQYATTPTQGASGSVVVNVTTVLSLSTVRTGVRTYIFQGRNLPRVAGQLITLYRVDSAGNEIRTSNLVTDSSGIYRVTRTFTGTGTFQFLVRTSQTLNNAAGHSNTITVAVH